MKKAEKRRLAREKGEKAREAERKVGLDALKREQERRRIQKLNENEEKFRRVDSPEARLLNAIFSTVSTDY